MGGLSTEVRTEPLCSYICELEEERKRLRRENDELQDENTKLRELCIRMRTYMAGVVEHNSYQIMTTGYTMLGGRIEECDEAMAKLGIEVDN